MGLSEASWATVTDDAVQLTVNAAEYVLQSGNFVKQWNFTRWSDETVNNLIADTALTSKKWYGYEFDTNGLLKRFKNYGATTSGPLTANGIEIMETLGILFPSGLTGGSGTPGAYDGKGDLSIRHNFGDDGIQLGSSNKTVTIQDLKQGQFVTIMLKSGNSTTARGISAVSNMTGAVGDATYMTGEQGDNVYNFEVVANGNATFTYNGGVIIRNIIVNQSPGVIEIIADPVVGIERDANTGVKTVTITCETEGVDIYYTTDGSATPDETSTLYTAPFTMEGTVFTVKVRAIKGNSKSQIVTTTWNDPFTFNPDAEYYVYSFGTNEGRNADNPKYLYAASAENLRWVEVAEGEDLPGKLGETSVTAAIWKLSAVDGNMVVFQNKSTGTSIIKYSFNYNLSAETPSTIAGANLGETGDAFYVAYRTEDKEKKVYSIQVSETDSKCMEVNDTRSETDLELANTVQFNNTYADRARFRWVIEDVNSTGFHPVDSGKVILSVEYIDLLGKRVAETTEGILIKKIRYTDGTSENKKVFLIK